jgi:hypothetical protein
MLNACLFNSVLSTSICISASVLNLSPLIRSVRDQVSSSGWDHSARRRTTAFLRPQNSAELCALQAPIASIRPFYSVENIIIPAFSRRLLIESAPHPKPLRAEGPGRELALLHFGLAAAISCKISVAVSMALCSWIYCGRLRSTASNHTAEVIDNKYYNPTIAVHCRLLRGSSKLISSQVHSTGLCHLSALFTTTYVPAKNCSNCRSQFWYQFEPRFAMSLHSRHLQHCWRGCWHQA